MKCLKEEREHKSFSSFVFVYNYLYIWKNRVIIIQEIVYMRDNFVVFDNSLKIWYTNRRRRFMYENMEEMSWNQ